MNLYFVCLLLLVFLGNFTQSLISQLEDYQLKVNSLSEINQKGILSKSYSIYFTTIMKKLSAQTLTPQSSPTNIPSSYPTSIPSSFPTSPSSSPTTQPSSHPTIAPTSKPTNPTSQPTSKPTNPTSQPTSKPSAEPTSFPTSFPSSRPTSRPTSPTSLPTSNPSQSPTAEPTSLPTAKPSSIPSDSPSSKPTSKPTSPSSVPTSSPSSPPSVSPSSSPSSRPTSQPSCIPSSKPSASPTSIPSSAPTHPTNTPTSFPSCTPSSMPSSAPTSIPTSLPTATPTSRPSPHPTDVPSRAPTSSPSSLPTTIPTDTPSTKPSPVPTHIPSSPPSSTPTIEPTSRPSGEPTSIPTTAPTTSPSTIPTSRPSSVPTHPTSSPTSLPTRPTSSPTSRPSAAPTQLYIAPSFMVLIDQGLSNLVVETSLAFWGVLVLLPTVIFFIHKLLGRRWSIHGLKTLNMEEAPKLSQSSHDLFRAYIFALLPQAFRARESNWRSFSSLLLGKHRYAIAMRRSFSMTPGTGMPLLAHLLPGLQVVTEISFLLFLTSAILSLQMIGPTCGSYHSVYNCKNPKTVFDSSQSACYWAQTDPNPSCQAVSDPFSPLALLFILILILAISMAFNNAFLNQGFKYFYLDETLQSPLLSNKLPPQGGLTLSNSTSAEDPEQSPIELPEHHTNRSDKRQAKAQNSAALNPLSRFGWLFLSNPSGFLWVSQDEASHQQAENSPFTSSSIKTSESKLISQRSVLDPSTTVSIDLEKGPSEPNTTNFLNGLSTVPSSSPSPRIEDGAQHSHQEIEPTRFRPSVPPANLFWPQKLSRRLNSSNAKAIRQLLTQRHLTHLITQAERLKSFSRQMDILGAKALRHASSKSFRFGDRPPAHLGRYSHAYQYQYLTRYMNHHRDKIKDSDLSRAHEQRTLTPTPMPDEESSQLSTTSLETERLTSTLLCLRSFLPDSSLESLFFDLHWGLCSPGADQPRREFSMDPQMSAWLSGKIDASIVEAHDRIFSFSTDGSLGYEEHSSLIHFLIMDLLGRGSIDALLYEHLWNDEFPKLYSVPKTTKYICLLLLLFADLGLIILAVYLSWVRSAIWNQQWIMCFIVVLFIEAVLIETLIVLALQIGRSSLIRRQTLQAVDQINATLDKVCNIPYSMTKTTMDDLIANYASEAWSELSFAKKAAHALPISPESILVEAFGISSTIEGFLPLQVSFWEAYKRFSLRYTGIPPPRYHVIRTERSSVGAALIDQGTERGLLEGNSYVSQCLQGFNDCLDRLGLQCFYSACHWYHLILRMKLRLKLWTTTFFKHLARGDKDFFCSILGFLVLVLAIVMLYVLYALGVTFYLMIPLIVALLLLTMVVSHSFCWTRSSIKIDPTGPYQVLQDLREQSIGLTNIWEYDKGLWEALEQFVGECNLNRSCLYHLLDSQATSSELTPNIDSDPEEDDRSISDSSISSSEDELACSSQPVDLDTENPILETELQPKPLAESEPKPELEPDAQKQQWVKQTASSFMDALWHQLEARITTRSRGQRQLSRSFTQQFLQQVVETLTTLLSTEPLPYQIFYPTSKTILENDQAARKSHASLMAASLVNHLLSQLSDQYPSPSPLLRQSDTLENPPSSTDPKDPSVQRRSEAFLDSILEELTRRRQLRKSPSETSPSPTQNREEPKELSIQRRSEAFLNSILEELSQRRQHIRKDFVPPYSLQYIQDLFSELLNQFTFSEAATQVDRPESELNSLNTSHVEDSMYSTKSFEKVKRGPMDPGDLADAPGRLADDEDEEDVQDDSTEDFSLFSRASRRSLYSHRMDRIEEDEEPSPSIYLIERESPGLHAQVNSLSQDGDEDDENDEDDTAIVIHEPEAYLNVAPEIPIVSSSVNSHAHTRDTIAVLDPLQLQQAIEFSHKDNEASSEHEYPVLRDVTEVSYSDTNSTDFSIYESDGSSLTSGEM